MSCNSNINKVKEEHRDFYGTRVAGSRRHVRTGRQCVRVLLLNSVSIATLDMS